MKEKERLEKYSVIHLGVCRYYGGMGCEIQSEGINTDLCGEHRKAKSILHVYLTFPLDAIKHAVSQ